MRRKDFSSLCFLVFLLFLFSSSLFAKSDPYSYPLKTVFLDAGHGGKDTGATSSFSWGKVIEKDLTLSLVSLVRDRLAVLHPEWHVVLTREDDSFVSLNDRCAVAYGTPLPSKSSALFVSLHVNSAENGEANGFEVLTKLPSQNVTLLDGFTPRQNITLFAAYGEKELNGLLENRDKAIAQTFEEILSERMLLSRSRGVKEQNVQVLWATRTPSVLVEVGFLSNEEEAKRLLSASWQKTMAEAIVHSIEAVSQT